MFKQIVVGTDGSAANMAVEKSIELAGLSGAVLYIVNGTRRPRRRRSPPRPRSARWPRKPSSSQVKRPRRTVSASATKRSRKPNARACER